MMALGTGLTGPDTDRGPGSQVASGETSRDWLAAFVRRRGRPLRVLHIGNIANNAYNNAKIQRNRGIAADVLSHDYYHIMACPEWEDADYLGEVGDPMFPDWWAARLGGFARPRWFVQGPLDACIRYLLATERGGRPAAMLWHSLQIERWLVCRRSRTSHAVHGLVKALSKRELANVVLPANALVLATAARWGGALARYVPLGRPRIAWWSSRCGRWARSAEIAADQPRHCRALAAMGNLLLRRARSVGSELSTEDLQSPFAWWWHPYLRLLMNRYDIVQGYATYTAMPFIIGRTDYVAYEHGTIRAIPFQDTAEGRLCAATYRSAAAVLITNSDNLAAADRLGLEPERLCFLPHAFDSDKLDRFACDHPPEPVGPGTPVLFFTPTRQHWVDGDPGWAKGNDRVLHAVRLLHHGGLELRLRLVAWGTDLAASRALAVELGIADLLDWIAPIKKRELWLEYLRANCVIDQFVVPALGGVGFEAMMLGRPLITALDVAQATRFFGHPPPLFPCRSIEEIAEAMLSVIRDPQKAVDRGAACREWMRRHHSADRIVDLQLAVYRRILDPQATRNARAA
jgi:glycosyltransferase involved in cell wall biosynthesis